VLLQRCRDRLDKEGGAKRANLLAVTQVFARLHFDKPEWLDILGGSKAMIESPFMQEIVAQSERSGQVEGMLHILQGKFGAVGPEISAGLAQVKEKADRP
jgi:predicted transposase YdaD